jgi:MFS family permease
LLLTAGSLADRFGRRLLFVIGTTVFTIGSLACGLAGNSLALSLSRAGQGIGGAIMFAAVLAFVAAVLCLLLIRQQDFLEHATGVAAGGLERRD